MRCMSSKLHIVFHEAPYPDEKTWWSYRPGVFSNVDIDEVLEECESLLSGHRDYQGISREISRKSCVFTSDISKARRYLTGYGDILFYPWETSPITLDIKSQVETYCGHAFDYALFHCYENGKATIAYHNDKESLNGEIASVSIGTRRKFRIRELEQTRGFCAEYELGHGDLFIMKKGMQRLYKHSVPKQLGIKEPRCNWTFRNFA